MLTLDSYSDDGSSFVSNMTGDSASSVMTLSFASHHQQAPEQMNGLQQTVLSYAANLFIFEEQQGASEESKQNGGGRNGDMIYDTLMLNNNNKENHHNSNMIIKHHKKSSRHNGWERPVCINANDMHSQRVWRFEI